MSPDTRSLQSFVSARLRPLGYREAEASMKKQTRPLLCVGVTGDEFPPRRRGDTLMEDT